MAQNLPPGKTMVSTHLSGDLIIRRVHSGTESGDISKMRRRRLRSIDNTPFEHQLREEKLTKQKSALREDFSRLHDKVQKLKAVLAQRGKSYRVGDGETRQAVPARKHSRDTGSAQVHDNLDAALDSLTHFFLVSLATLLALWLAVNLFRGVAVYLLPELFLECAVVEPAPLTLADAGTEVSHLQARTTLAWQLLFGRHPCQPVYLPCGEHHQVQ
ncbi:uncharacterized protein LOC110975168 [Acanthaster planci]|uniref:Uncharacterized protein LOC110975168 n=1 Tax=Acanthaster planci TaxID=133434 RepID=A0A8B7XT14_ACAPL|nr:uncharacterized protein LOC110975168 [Acanthaster planci]